MKISAILKNKQNQHMLNPSSLVMIIVWVTAAEQQGRTAAITNRKLEIFRVFVVLGEPQDFEKVFSLIQ